MSAGNSGNTHTHTHTYIYIYFLAKLRFNKLINYLLEKRISWWQIHTQVLSTVEESSLSFETLAANTAYT